MSNHTTRNYFPSTEKEQFIWATNFVTELPQFRAALGLPEDTIVLLNGALSFLQKIYNFHAAAVSIARERTANKHSAEWSPVGQTVTVQANTTPTGPTSTATNPGGGLYAQIFGSVDGFINSPKCTPDIKTTLRLNPLPKPDPVLADLVSEVNAKFTGGEVLFHLTRPAPAKLIRINCDRHDGAGVKTVAVIAQARFTDHHELPAERTNWDYHVNLLDGDGNELGKTVYITVAVRKDGL
ncbi:MAG: hypothetical protein LBK60_05685 [Verrucomicrobiales bacterium]|jgi:hypothetical protein|nr:hypothetical protein [Verrucomicrobiales bacterium]